jgi:hypothetical protein
VSWRTRLVATLSKSTPTHPSPSTNPSPYGASSTASSASVHDSHFERSVTLAFRPSASHGTFVQAPSRSPTFQRIHRSASFMLSAIPSGSNAMRGRALPFLST